MYIYIMTTQIVIILVVAMTIIIIIMIMIKIVLVVTPPGPPGRWGGKWPPGAPWENFGRRVLVKTGTQFSKGPRKGLGRRHIQVQVLPKLFQALI